MLTCVVNWRTQREAQLESEKLRKQLNTSNKDVLKFIEGKSSSNTSDQYLNHFLTLIQGEIGNKIRTVRLNGTSQFYISIKPFSYLLLFQNLSMVIFHEPELEDIFISKTLPKYIKKLGHSRLKVMFEYDSNCYYQQFPQLAFDFVIACGTTVNVRIVSIIFEHRRNFPSNTNTHTELNLLPTTMGLHGKRLENVKSLILKNQIRPSLFRVIAHTNDFIYHQYKVLSERKGFLTKREYFNHY